MTIPKSIPQNRYRLGTERPQDGIVIPRHLVHAAAAAYRGQAEQIEGYKFLSREVESMARRNAARRRRDADALEAAEAAITAVDARRKASEMDDALRADEAEEAKLEAARQERTERLRRRAAR